MARKTPGTPGRPGPPQRPRILAEIRPSPPRRWLGVGMLVILGALLVYVALATPPAGIVWQLFLLGAGLAALVAAQAMWRATERHLILEEGPGGLSLVDSAGELLAREDDITRVERGMFAMKPSNGFSVRLARPGPRVWRPGLWWRLGRQLAVGGVTSGAETRPVADILKMRLSERAARDDLGA